MQALHLYFKVKVSSATKLEMPQHQVCDSGYLDSSCMSCRNNLLFLDSKSPPRLQLSKNIDGIVPVRCMTKRYTN